ncbi:MAG: hypothetical protein ABT940_00565 [Alphaproteobacteria bacterium]
MDYVVSVWEFFKSDAGTGILVGLLAISEALASIPAVQSNSVYQIIVNTLRRVTNKPTV